MLLCRHHHRLIHHEGYAVTIHAQNALVFSDPTGRQLVQAVYPQFDTPGSQVDAMPTVELQARESGLEINAGTAVTAWQGEAMDYDLAVSALWQLREIEKPSSEYDGC